MSNRRYSVKHFARKLKEKLFSLKGTPQYIAKGFALGSFIGMVPIPGFQVFVAFFLAAWFKVNKTAACMAVFNTNAVTGIPIFYFNYWLGKRLLGIQLDFAFPKSISWDFALIIWNAGKMVFASLVVGGFFTGILAAILAYYSYFLWIRWRKPIISSKTQYAESRLDQALNTETSFPHKQS